MHPTDIHSGLTQERLKALLHYEPATGVFTWLVERPNGVKIGDRAGSFSRSVGYWLIKIDGRQFLASRLAWLYMTGAWPICKIDHENLDKIDNRWGNLRHAWSDQNQQNKPITVSNTSGFKGVSYQPRRGRWQANIRVSGRLIFLGRFRTPELAHAAYVRAASHHFGDFARAA